MNLTAFDSCRSFTDLPFAAIAGAFSLPLLYDKYEDIVDEYVALGLAEVDKLYKVAEDKVLTLLNRKPKKLD